MAEAGSGAHEQETLAARGQGSGGGSGGAGAVLLGTSRGGAWRGGRRRRGLLLFGRALVRGEVLRRVLLCVPEQVMQALRLWRRRRGQGYCAVRLVRRDPRAAGARAPSAERELCSDDKETGVVRARHGTPPIAAAGESGMLSVRHNCSRGGFIGRCQMGGWVQTSSPKVLMATAPVGRILMGFPSPSSS